MLANQVSIAVKDGEFFSQSIVHQELVTIFVNEHHGSQRLRLVVTDGFRAKESGVLDGGGMINLGERFYGGVLDIVASEFAPIGV